jgi:hypothetical protein
MVLLHASPRAYDKFVTLAAEDLMCAPLLDNFFLCSSLLEVCLGSPPGIIHTYTGGCGRTNSAGFGREAEAIPKILARTRQRRTIANLLPIPGYPRRQKLQVH